MTPKRAVAVIADRHQLSPQWLNDESKDFLPTDFDDARSTVVAEHSYLTVRVPHPDDVFVMKLHASRGEGDLADMVRLWPTCSFGTASEAVTRYATAYPREIDDPALAEYIAEYVIARRRRRSPTRQDCRSWGAPVGEAATSRDSCAARTALRSRCGPLRRDCWTRCSPTTARRSRPPN